MQRTCSSCGITFCRSSELLLPQEEAPLTGIMKFKHDLAEALQQQERQRQERRCLANPSLSMQEAQPCTPHGLVTLSLSPSFHGLYVIGHAMWSTIPFACPTARLMLCLSCYELARIRS